MLASVFSSAELVSCANGPGGPSQPNTPLTQPWRCERKKGKSAQRQCKRMVDQCEARRPTFNATLCKVSAMCMRGCHTPQPMVSLVSALNYIW